MKSEKKECVFINSKFMDEKPFLFHFEKDNELVICNWDDEEKAVM